MPPRDIPPARAPPVQRSVSGRLMLADQMAEGKAIWVEDERDVWVLTSLVQQQNTILKVRRKGSTEVLEIDLGFGKTHPHNPKVVSDMTALHYIHEASILYNLGERAKLDNQRPYTFMGTILIAVNPLRRVADPDMSEFTDRSINPEAPHPYAIAELAYHQMRLGAGRKEANQSIVVSGESGAGKTETAKIILRFLTHRSVGGASGMEQKVADSNPILESFGNAKTLRNNNSSRFGKFLKMQFTKGKYRLAGAFIETYLLEKSRVLSQGEGERNFHILYELVAGAATSDLAAQLELGSAETYRILSNGGCITLPGVDDATQFRSVRNALDTIGMDAQLQMQVWQSLAAVLHMSNLRFDKLDTEQGEVAAISDRTALSTIASLLGIGDDVLESMLIKRVVETRGDVFIKQLSVHDADLTRDAIVKSLYEALFLWVVCVVNTSLGKGEESLPFIGVLDIFGFENFDTKNEFEQLLINFTNESLQDTFNKQVFNNELKLYEEEGIDVVVSSCPDNTRCLLMLSKTPDGIIPSLDNICAEPNSNDARYLDGLHKMYNRHQDFPRTQPKDMRECFWVKHYAGRVKYTVHGWVERNMDRIPKSFKETLRSSTHQVVRESASKYGVMTVDGSSLSRRTKGLVRPTVANGFLASMRKLNETLVETTCNFARCIKPNAAMQCGVYDNKYVVEQLQCLGILQTCEVLKVGMPTRVTYTELKEVLGSNAAKADKLFADEPETALIASILWAFEVPIESFRLGKTRVFFRAGQISTLQKILNETPAEKGPWIFSRLQKALANRHKAKAAAEEAKAMLAKVKEVMADAEKATSSVLESDSDNESGSPTRARMTFPAGVSEGELEPIVKAAKKARVAGSTAPQVHILLQAADEDDVGTYAEGAKERILAASETTLADIDTAAAKADELEANIQAVRGGDEAAALRRLEDGLKKLRVAFKEVKGLAQGAEEAAAKLQVQKTEDMTAEATVKASAVEIQARVVANEAKSMVHASEKQQEAFEKAKAATRGVVDAGEKAQSAFRALKSIVKTACEEEEHAREAKIAKVQREEQEKRRAMEAAVAAAEKAKKEKEEAVAAAATTAEASTSVKVIAPKVDKAPAEKIHKKVIGKQPSWTIAEKKASFRRPRYGSVKKLLGSQRIRTPEPSPPPKREDSSASLSSVATQSEPQSTAGLNHFEAVFAEAMAGGCLQGYLIKQKKRHLMNQKRATARWQRYYFILEDGFLTHYDDKSLVGTSDKKVLELTSTSTTGFTSSKNCFCVRTESRVWFLNAKDRPSVTRWMAAINAHIYLLWLADYTPPEDDYWNQGTSDRFFFSVPENSAPKWIFTHPEGGAPRTGEGVFPMEVIEVTQLLPIGDVLYLRIADDRGWVCDGLAEDGQPCLAKVAGEIIEDNRVIKMPRGAHVLRGPSAISEVTGEIIPPGDRVQAVERFTPEPNAGVVFFKLAEGRGWVSMSSGDVKQADRCCISCSKTSMPTSCSKIA